MSGNSGILSPAKSPNRQSSPDESEDPISTTTRAKELSDSKSASKCVRVLTVLAYILSVSMAAILLSLYYVFLWNPSPPSEPETPMAYRDLRHSYIEKSNRSSNIEETTPNPFQQQVYSTYNSTTEDEVSSTPFATSFNDTEQLTWSTIPHESSSPPSPEMKKESRSLLFKLTNNMFDNEKQPNNT